MNVLPLKASFKREQVKTLLEMDFHKEDDDIIRSSRSQLLLKTGALKKFVIITGKRLCWSLSLIKLLGFRPVTLFKRDSWVHIVKILSTPFLRNTSSACSFVILRLLIA